MPELPDIALYLEALALRVLQQPLECLRIANPFLVRTPDPPVSVAEGRTVVALRRMGKRIIFELDGDLFLVLHLMIAGRLRWRDRGAAIPGKVGLAAFDFPTGSAILTEAGSKRQASLHVVAGAANLASLDPGGLEVFDSTHAARLSPMKLTSSLSDEEMARLHTAVIETLEKWIERLRDETAGDFPDKVTAFREGMAVHGRYRQPCPRCGAPVQRIVYARNEANYCATCQTGGRLLSDRALSRLLKDDWPKTVEDMERRLRRTL